MRDVNSVEQQFSFQSLYYEIFTLDTFRRYYRQPGVQPDIVRNKNNGDARDEDRNHKMLPVSSCMSIYSKRATIACHGFLRGQEFSLEHMIDCIIGNAMYL